MKEFFNCFIGIPLNSEFKYDMEELQRKMQNILPNASLIEPAYAHTTLYYLGHQTEKKLDEIAHIIHEENDLIHDEEVQIGNMGIFRRDNFNDNTTKKVPYVIFLEIIHTTSLNDFKLHLNAHLDTYNREERDIFIPHMTLARLKTTQALEQFRENHDKVSNLLAEVKWKFKLKEIVVYGKPNLNISTNQTPIFRIPLM
jgi:2'-5' RNA ligase